MRNRKPNNPNRQLVAPEWLQRSWDAAKSNGLNELSMGETDAEIAADYGGAHFTRQREGRYRLPEGSDYCGFHCGR